NDPRRIDPPLRSRRAVCLLPLSRGAVGGRNCWINEPQSRLLRRCPNGELLPYPQDRTRSSSQLQDPRRSPARYLSLHRRLLQSNPAPFRHRIYRPDRDAAKNSVTLSTSSGEDRRILSDISSRVRVR